MAEFWLSDTDFLVPVQLKIERRNRWLGALATGKEWDDEERQQVSHVRWRQSSRTHEISYHETPPSGRGGQGNNHDGADTDEDSVTICRLQPGVLTWHRHGGVEWEHVFKTGESSCSLMTVPQAGSIEVKLQTRDLKLTVEPAGGSIYVAYDMTISDVTQYVELTMRFERT